VRLIYLATPYNHPDPEVRESRFKAACEVAAHFMRSGVHLFCPIAHTHPIAEAGDLPRGWEYWQAYDRAMLFACTELWVVRMDGWRESRGIRGEVEIARELGIPVKHVRYWDNEIVGDLEVVDAED
jgi:hypothetical protein